MRAFLVLMGLVNVGLAAASGFLVMKAPLVFDTVGAGEGVPEAVVPFVLVAAFPVFCLIAAAVPLVLAGRGWKLRATITALLPPVIAAAVYTTTQI